MNNGNELSEFIVDKSLPFIDSKGLLSLRQVSKKLCISSSNELFDKISSDLKYQNQLIKSVIYSKKHDDFPISPNKLWQWLYNSAFILNHEEIINCLSLIGAKKNIVLTIKDELLNDLINNDKIHQINSIKITLNATQIQKLIPAVKSWLENQKGDASTTEILQFILPNCREGDIQELLLLAKENLSHVENIESISYASSLLKIIKDRLSETDIKNLLKKAEKNPLALLKTFTVLAPALKDYKTIQNLLPKLIQLAKYTIGLSDLDWVKVSEEERSRRMEQGLEFKIQPHAIKALKALVHLLQEKEIKLLFMSIKKEPLDYKELLSVLIPRLSAKEIQKLVIEIRKKLTDKSVPGRRAAIAILNYFTPHLDDKTLKSLVECFISLLNPNDNDLHLGRHKGEVEKDLEQLKIFMPLLKKEHIHKLLLNINEQLNKGTVFIAFSTLKTLLPLLKKEDLQCLLPEIKAQLRNKNSTIRKAAIEKILTIFKPEEALILLRDENHANLLKNILLDLQISRSDIEYLLTEIKNDLKSEEPMQEKELFKLAMLLPLFDKDDIKISDIEPLLSQTEDRLSDYTNFYTKQAQNFFEILLRVLEQLDSKTFYIEKILLPVKQDLNVSKRQKLALIFLKRLQLFNKIFIQESDINSFLQKLKNSLDKSDASKFLEELTPSLDKKDKDLMLELRSLVILTPADREFNLKLLLILKTFTPSLEKEELQKLLTLALNFAHTYFYNGLKYDPIPLLKINLSAEQLESFIDQTKNNCDTHKKVCPGLEFYLANASVKSTTGNPAKITEERFLFQDLLTTWIEQIKETKLTTHPAFFPRAVEEKPPLPTTSAYKL